jgi:hypothetical protein
MVREGGGRERGGGRGVVKGEDLINIYLAASHRNTPVAMDLKPEFTEARGKMDAGVGCEREEQGRRIGKQM